MHYETSIICAGNCLKSHVIIETGFFINLFLLSVSETLLKAGAEVEVCDLSNFIGCFHPVSFFSTFFLSTSVYAFLYSNHLQMVNYLYYNILTNLFKILEVLKLQLR